MEEILTPKDISFVNSDYQFEAAVLTGEYSSWHISDKRLTCCCDIGDYIACAGFSGELYLVKNGETERFDHISSSIIRCLLWHCGVLFLATDAGEIIIWNENKIAFSAHTDSEVYKIIAVDDRTLITTERNGDVKEWAYLSGQLVLNRVIKKVGRPVFTLGFYKSRLIIGDSQGECYFIDRTGQYESNKKIASCNIFCLAADETSYYGLNDGIIIKDNDDVQKPIQAHQSAVRDLTFSPRKRWLFSVGKDKVVKAWNKDNPCVLATVQDYLYQVIAGQRYIAFVDGNGDLGRIDFDGDIDNAKQLRIKL